jgi:hypothetical protein
MQNEKSGTDKTMDLLYFIYILAKHKGLIISLVLITVAVTGGYLWYVSSRLAPVYRSYAVLAANGDLSFDNFRIVDNSFKDPQVIYEIIQNHRLMPLIYPHLWDGTRSQWLIANPPTLDEACLSLIRMLHVATRDVHHYSLKLEMIAPNPQLAQSFLKYFIGEMSNRLRLKKLNPLLTDVSYLKARLPNAGEKEKADLLNNIRTLERKIFLMEAREFHGFDVIIGPTPPKREVNPLSLKARPAALILSVTVLSLMAAMYLAFFVEYWQNLKRRKPDKYLALREALRWNRDRT